MSQEADLKAIKAANRPNLDALEYAWYVALLLHVVIKYVPFFQGGAWDVVSHVLMYVYMILFAAVAVRWCIRKYRIIRGYRDRG
jgi:hypothetical protein